MGMFSSFRTSRAQKRHDEEAHHVKGGEEIDHRDYQTRGWIVFERCGHDTVLTPETGQGRTPGQCQGCYQKCPERKRHLLPQAAHLPHVLFIVQRVNDRTRAKEEQGFEKGMGEQMKKSRNGDAQTDSRHHQPQLRQR